MQPLTTWQNAPEQITLASSAMHIWRIELHHDRRDFVARARMSLNDEERNRADRLITEKPRAQFTIARAAMRSILSRYVNIPAAELNFTYGLQGKPALADGDLSFNLSHSGDFALLAVTLHSEIGVDIELIDPLRAAEDIADRFFSPAEQQSFRVYSGPEKVAAFFRCWSRKEAVIKALGEGLICPLHSFDVSLDREDARLLALRRDGATIQAWSMISIEAHPDYAAAAVITGPCREVNGWNYCYDFD